MATICSSTSWRLRLELDRLAHLGAAPRAAPPWWPARRCGTPGPAPGPTFSTTIAACAANTPSSSMARSVEGATPWSARRRGHTDHLVVERSSAPTSRVRKPATAWRSWRPYSGSSRTSSICWIVRSSATRPTSAAAAELHRVARGCTRRNSAETRPRPGLSEYVTLEQVELASVGPAEPGRALDNGVEDAAGAVALTTQRLDDLLARPGLLQGVAQLVEHVLRGHSTCGGRRAHRRRGGLRLVGHRSSLGRLPSSRAGLRTATVGRWLPTSLLG